MIQMCISSRAFAPETSLSAMAEFSARAGFDGVELVVNDRGELNLATSHADIAGVLRHFSEAGLAVAALTSDLYTTHNFASPDESSRWTAMETTRRLIELACRLEAPLVWLHGAVIDPSKPSSESVPYETALNHVFEGVMETAEQAEKHGVRIAIRAADGGFLLSPVETRDLVDRLNSPAIGVAFGLNDIARIGCPVDWLRCLNYRLHAAFLSASDGPNGETGVIDTAMVCETLHEVHYKGPLIYESAGDLSDIAALLKTLSA